MAQVGCIPDYSGCTYHTVTLNKDEVFILPPNTEVVGATNPAALSSPDGCYDVATIEPTYRYRVQYEIEVDNDNGTDAWENAQFLGMRVGGTNAPYISANFDANYNQTGIINFLQSNHYPATNYGQYVNSGWHGMRQLIIEFDTIPSIANNTILYFSSRYNDGVLTGTNMEIIPYKI
jgi:hypothetical protein